MALAVERHWPAGCAARRNRADALRARPADRRALRVIEASHPIPDEAGEKAGARDSRKRPRPRARRSPARARVGRRLGAAFASGRRRADGRPQGCDVAAAAVRRRDQEINTVRKHLSAIQGGQLAVASRAPVLALVISDVTGDDPTRIASGPARPIRPRTPIRSRSSAKYSIERRCRCAGRLESGAEGRTPGDAEAGRSRAESRRDARDRHRAPLARGRRGSGLRNGGVTPAVLSDFDHRRSSPRWRRSWPRSRAKCVATERRGGRAPR